MSNPIATLPLLKYVYTTGCFKRHFNKDANNHIQMNAKRNAELHLAVTNVSTTMSINAQTTSNHLSP